MKKTVLKLIGILFLVTALVCTQIPVLGTNASSSANNGFMMDGTKLVKYTGTANAVSVPNGVKTIGAEAFSENISLSSISFPSGLETIENGAFSGCTQLRRLVIPEGCTTIENGAFADCDKLEYISIPASLSELGTSVFAGCDRLKSIDLAAGNPNFICDDGVLYNNKKSIIYQVLSGRTNSVYNMPDSVEEIKKYAFWGCLNLKNVNVSSNLKEIGDYAFSNASAMESIVLPYSVRAIRQKAFEDCRHLKDVTIPGSVTQIDETAFDGCYSLNIIAESGSAGERFKNDFEASITANMEYEDSVSQNNTVTNPIKDQDNKALNIPYASDVEHYVEWDVDSPGVLGRSKIVSGQAVVLMKTDESEILGGENSGAVSDNSTFVLPDGAIVNQDTIGYKAFYCDSAISNIQIPGSVKKIDSFAFSRSGLTEIDIPYGVTKIGNAAFYHCDNLEKVTIPNSVSEIGEDAFSYTKWLDNWYHSDASDDFLIVGDGILLAYKGNAATINIPSGVKQIGAGTFKNHNEIQKVNIPDSVFVINEDAFFNCSSLDTVSGMNHVTAIKDRAFYGCPITTVRIPASVCEIGVSAFGGTSKSDCVIFLGTSIPKLSYEESSTRLSGQRNPVFDGIDVAVVDRTITGDSIKNTVLDKDVSNFMGVVFQISDYDAGIAAPIISNKSQDDTDMPETIRVYGKSYTVLPKGSVQYAHMTDTVSDNSLQDLLNVSHSQWQKEDVFVSQSGSTIDLSGYHLYFSEADENSLELADAIKQYYGETDDTNCVFFDLSMNDPSNHIPIKQLGKNTISITVSVPSQMIGKDLCVVTLDRNKKPEVLFGTLHTKNGKQYVSFEVSHFSPFALYVPEGELKNRIVQKNSNSSGLSGLDQTPDTGDYVNMKLILILGLSSLGAFFLVLGFTYPLIRRKKKPC
ncbi:MAG: leucine-rich repeat domain-containing protein [Lachnospiraceae bacterium]|nr:leucine-rich repeat domain-containing protein [Lachnospiraceae bacterium]